MFNIHLQWFAEEEDVEILVEGLDEIPNKDEGPTKEELALEVKNLKETQVVLEKQADSASKFESGLDKLGNILSTPVQPQPQVPQPQESEEDFAKEYNKTVFKDAYKATTELFVKKLMPELQKGMGKNLQYSRRFCKLDPVTKDSFKKYEAEVDDMVSKMDPRQKFEDEHIYDKALNMVKLNHIDDIISDAKEDAIKVVQEEYKKKDEIQVSQGQYSEAGVNPRTGPTQIRTLTKEEVAWGARKGIKDKKILWRHLHGRE